MNKLSILSQTPVLRALIYASIRGWIVSRRLPPPLRLCWLWRTFTPPLWLRLR